MDDFKVRCVKVFGHPETQKLIEEAFKCLKDQKLAPEWFTEDACFSVTQRKKNEVYVFDVFSGEAFEHIAGLSCRILGPLAVITSLACKTDIPRRVTPVYNLAMKDIIVCCTNIDASVRDQIYKKVEWMGGQAYRAFTEDVTHMVAGSVGRKKYQIAGSMEKKIMIPKWVEAVWEKSKLEAVHGDDEQFQEFRCPIFYGLVITASGLNSQERQEAKRLIEKEGGVYSGEMKAKECTHLLINEAKGQKYLFAKKWEIFIIRSEWLYESIEKGFCQDEANFPVEEGGTSERKMKTSTPERRSMAGEITDGDISNISMISICNVNETACTTFGNSSTRLEDITEHLDVTKAPAEMFLDGCKMYLSGFRGSALEKLRKIINMGGGTRFNQITDNLTHIVIGERINSDIEIIKSLATKPHVVTAQWLVESFKQEKHLEEAPYLSAEIPHEAHKTPEVKGSRKKSVAPKDMKTNTGHEAAEEKGDDMHDIMSQYLPTDQNKTTGDVTRSGDMTVAPGAADEDLTQDPNASQGSAEGVFAGKSFVFLGYEEESLSVLYTYVKERGGVVIQSNSRMIPDYAVVPVDGYPVNRTVKNIVTEVWLLMCVEHSELFDVNLNPLFVPIEIHYETKPLQGCVLSFSGYAETERQTLVDVAEALGAKNQECFVRSTKREGLLPNTHLVVNAPQGSKYKAAKQWHIPAVSKLWLLACAKSGRKEAEEIYLIDNVFDDNTLSENPTTHVPKNNQSVDVNKDNQPDAVMNNQSGDNQREAQTVSSKNEPKDIKEQSSKNDVEMNEKPEEVTNARNVEVAANIAAGLDNETNMPDFSTMGDTEAILAGLNTQGEQNTLQDNDKSAEVEISDKTVESDGHAESDNKETASRSDNITGTSYETNKLEVNTVDKAGSELKSEDVNSRARLDSEPVSGNDTTVSIENKESPPGLEPREGARQQGGDSARMVIVNKHLKNVQSQPPREQQKKTETPPLTRFMRNLETDPPKMGTPGLAKQSLFEKLKEKNTGQSYKLPEHDFSVDTPPYNKYVKKILAQPKTLGTPQLSETSARDELLGKNHVGSRTAEVKRRRDQMRQSQKENLETPLESRVKDLRDQEETVDKDTPSKFLNPEVRYVPEFIIEDSDLDTPGNPKRGRSRKRKNSLDDDELFEQAIKKVNKRFEDAAATCQNAIPRSSQSSQAMGDELDGDYEEPCTVLKGVVITVAKKLAKDQEELNDIVASLGGNYRWSYDSSCTHFIFQGRQNDTARDFKHAKSKGLKIVSPHWVYMCEEQKAHVDESLFPHTFNPNLSLSVVSTKRTPLRTPRSSRRTAKAVSKVDPVPLSEPVVIDETNDVKPQESNSGPMSEASTSAGPEKTKTLVSTPKTAVKNSKSPVTTVPTPKLNLKKTLKSPQRTSSDEEEKPIALETGGSLEMREALSRQLEDVMSKAKKRRRSKRLNCSGNVSTPEDPPNSSSRSSRRTQENQKNSSLRSSRGATGEEVEEKNSAEPAPSQPFHVSWDDPMSRLEQAKLAHKLERANSPTQEVGGMYDLDPEDAQYSESEEEAAPVPPFEDQKRVHEKTTPKHSVPARDKTPTPEGPSISFPTSDKSRKVTPPKPVVVDDEEEEADNAQQPPPVFIMSGLSTAERDDYGALVEQLGGKVIDTQSFDTSCTHLVINNMTRNEKFLASIASGRWVLHKSYFEACRQEKRFVQEDLYEWGSEGTLSLVKNMESNVRLLAIAARDWRLKIQEEKSKSPDNYGAFASWRVVLCCDSGREPSYRRLLKAGGATVLSVKPPYKNSVDATHALLDLNKAPVEQQDLEILLNSGCLCLKVDYISGYLCNPNVDVTDYEPPEITALKTVLSEASESTGKRKKSSSNNTSQKRSKRR